ncbi:MAG: putative molybdenum carrier protein [Thermodesulfobacteriota bacterium]
MAIEMIVSGGQTGVDRAALDVALELGIRCGGWCPRGRKAEDGVIDGRYPLRETGSDKYSQRTEWNVRDSDGTLILTVGEPTGGTASTIKAAEEHGRPCLVLDPSTGGDAERFREWTETEMIETLNVAGPRESTLPGIYDMAAAFLRKILQ